MIKDIQDELSTELKNISKDSVIEFGEIGLDLMLDEGVLKEVPIVKTILSICKIGLNIRDRFFTRKLLLFINGIKSKDYDEEKYKQFKDDLNDNAYKNKVTEKIILIIDYLREETKIDYLTNLFESLINQKISWNEFCRFSNLVDMLEEHDFKLLEFLGENPDAEIYLEDSRMNDLSIYINKLAQFELAHQIIMKSFVWGETPAKVLYKITPIGLKLLEGLNL